MNKFSKELTFYLLMAYQSPNFHTKKNFGQKYHFWKAISLLVILGETGSTPVKRIFIDNRIWLEHKKAATSLSTLKDASKKVAQNLTNLFAATRRQRTFSGQKNQKKISCKKYGIFPRSLDHLLQFGCTAQPWALLWNGRIQFISVLKFVFTFLTRLKKINNKRKNRSLKVITPNLMVMH